jgi:hypothetical protein
MNTLFGFLFLFFLAFSYLIVVFNRLQQTLNNISHARDATKIFAQKRDSISQEKVEYSTRVLKSLEIDLESMLKRPDYLLMLNFLKWHPEIKMREKK